MDAKAWLEKVYSDGVTVLTISPIDISITTIKKNQLLNKMKMKYTITQHDTVCTNENNFGSMKSQIQFFFYFSQRDLRYCCPSLPVKHICLIQIRQENWYLIMALWVNTLIERNLTAIETEIEMGAQHVVHDYSKRCCQEHAIFAYELHPRPFIASLLYLNQYL